MVLSLPTPVSSNTLYILISYAVIIKSAARRIFLLLREDDSSWKSWDNLFFLYKPGNGLKTLLCESHGDTAGVSQSLKVKRKDENRSGCDGVNDSASI